LSSWLLVILIFFFIFTKFFFNFFLKNILARLRCDLPYSALAPLFKQSPVNRSAIQSPIQRVLPFLSQFTRESLYCKSQLEDHLPPQTKRVWEKDIDPPFVLGDSSYSRHFKFFRSSFQKFGYNSHRKTDAVNIVGLCWPNAYPIAFSKSISGNTKDEAALIKFLEAEPDVARFIYHATNGRLCLDRGYRGKNGKLTVKLYNETLIFIITTPERAGTEGHQFSKDQC